MLSAPDRVSIETALYNLDQPVVLGDIAKHIEEDTYEIEIYEAGLKRGAIEAMAMMLAYEHNMNEIWQGRPLTIERGKYGKYERSSNNGY